VVFLFNRMGQVQQSAKELGKPAKSTMKLQTLLQVQYSSPSYGLRSMALPV
jgi:hypothetical protein